MMDLRVPLEERLLHGYRAQLRHYDCAAEILDKAGTGDPHEDHWAHALHAKLQETAALDAAMSEDIAAWHASARPPVGPLREILEKLTERIRSLSEGIERQVSELRARQRGLVGEADEFIQERRMLQAYVKYG